MRIRQKEARNHKILNGPWWSVDFPKETGVNVFPPAATKNILDLTFPPIDSYLVFEELKL